MVLLQGLVRQQISLTQYHFWQMKTRPMLGAVIHVNGGLYLPIRLHDAENRSSNHGFTKDTNCKFKLCAEYNTSDEQEKAIEKLKLPLKNSQERAFFSASRFRQNICHGQSD